MHLLECLLHTVPPSLQALLLRPSFTSTPVLLPFSAALTGKRPLLPCKVASIAGGHLVCAAAFSYIPAYYNKQTVN